MAKKRGKSGKQKTSATKLFNKKQNKLAKQGKLKKSQLKKKTRPDGSAALAAERKREEEEQESDVPLEKEDIEFAQTADAAFLVNGHSRQQKRKRKHKDDEEKEYDFPKRQKTEEIKGRMAVPVMKDGVLVPRMVPLPEDEDEEVDGDANDGVDSLEREEEPPADESDEELPKTREEKLQEKKMKMSSLAKLIISNPEENIRRLRELCMMLEERDPDVCVVVRKLAMLSVMEIFKDILPGYRIRLPTQQELEQRAKKETKQLRDYETALLQTYKGYLDFLDKTLKGYKQKEKKGKSKPALQLPEEAKKGLKVIAVKCLCGILTTHPHFNYRNNIVTLLIPLLTLKNEQITREIHGMVKTVFAEDKTGEVTLEIVRSIGKLVKDKNFNVPRHVVDTFFSLKIKEIDRDEKKKIDAKKAREQWKRMSRRERKKRKHASELEKELMETKATEDKSKKLQLHTEIIGAVFTTYFRVLKRAPKSPLLPSVLGGLAKFAHLINVSFFDDLFQVFRHLMESGELSERENLHCVETAFTVLSGQGSALTIDPIKFYQQLYCSLSYAGLGRGQREVVGCVVRCLQKAVVLRRRHVSEQRVLAYLKRLASVCLLQRSPASCLALLAACRTLVQMFPFTDKLFDNESAGSGMYQPELEDPEHCNAHNSMLWEVTLLKHHYHPAVRSYANHLSFQCPTSGNGQLSVDFLRKSPQDMLGESADDLETLEAAISKSQPTKKVKPASSSKDIVEKYTAKLTEKLSNSQLDLFLHS